MNCNHKLSLPDGKGSLNKEINLRQLYSTSLKFEEIHPALSDSPVVSSQPLCQGDSYDMLKKYESKLSNSIDMLKWEGNGRWEKYHQSDRI